MIGHVQKLFLIFLITVMAFSSCSKEVDVKITEPVESVPIETQEADLNMGVITSEGLIGTHFANNLSEIKKRFDGIRDEIEKEKRNPFRNVPPDESGKVMIIMFHSFIEVYEDGDDTAITTTLSAFRELLETLYNEGYRTTSLSDFINGNISVQRGCKPIIFTFDDGRKSQFSFVENEDGTIVENTKTAVAVMEQFYEEFPDFGLNGTFFLNLGFAGTFGTAGTLQQRLEAMAKKGFELESHTYNHVNLAKLSTPEQIMAELGENSKTLNELVPGRSMSIFALPYGNSNKSLEQYIISGVFEGFEYENKGIMLVGAEPAAPMYLENSDPVKIRRILASGIVPVSSDFGWWFAQKKHEFISDGNPDTISVPSDKLDLISEDKVSELGKELVIIESVSTE